MKVGHVRDCTNSFNEGASQMEHDHNLRLDNAAIHLKRPTIRKNNKTSSSLGILYIWRFMTMKWNQLHELWLVSVRYTIENHQSHHSVNYTHLLYMYTILLRLLVVTPYQWPVEPLLRVAACDLRYKTKYILYSTIFMRLSRRNERYDVRHLISFYTTINKNTMGYDKSLEQCKYTLRWCMPSGRVWSFSSYTLVLCENICGFMSCVR